MCTEAVFAGGKLLFMIDGIVLFQPADLTTMPMVIVAQVGPRGKVEVLPGGKALPIDKAALVSALRKALLILLPTCPSVRRLGECYVWAAGLNKKWTRSGGSTWKPVGVACGCGKLAAPGRPPLHKYCYDCRYSLPEWRYRQEWSERWPEKIWVTGQREDDDIVELLDRTGLTIWPFFRWYRQGTAWVEDPEH